jgi:uncharacterized protein involved in outer membrane biogenesis
MLTRRKVLWGLCCFVVILILFITLILPGIVRNVAVEKITTATGRKAAIAHIALNPFTLTAKVDGFRLAEKGSDAAFASFSSVKVTVSPASLVKRGLVVSECRIVSPYAHIVRTGANSFNFSDLLVAGPKPKNEKPFLFSLNNITVTGGSVDFADHVPVRPADHTVRQMEIAVPFISNIPYLADKYVQPHFSAVINGALLVLEGKLKPLSKAVEASLHLNIKNVDIPFYLDYLPLPPPITVVSGRFTCAVDAAYRVSSEQKPELSLSGQLNLADLAVRERSGEPLVSLAKGEVKLTKAAVFTRSFDIGSVSSEGLDLHVSRDRKGVLNLVRLFAPARPAVATAPETGNGKEGEGGEQQKSKIKLDSFASLDGTVHFRDDQPAGGFRTDLNGIALKLNDFNSVGEAPAKWSAEFRTGRDETVALAGTLVPESTTMQADATVKGIVLEAYYPYLAEILTAQVSGRLDLNAAIGYNRKEGVTINRTSMEIHRLAAPFASDEGLKVKRITLDGGSFHLDKRIAVVEKIAVSGADLRLSREANGDFSPLRLLRRKEAAPPAAKAAASPDKQAPPFSYRLHHLVGDGLKVTFTDRTREEEPVFTLSRLAVALDNITGPRFGAIPVRMSAAYGASGAVRMKGTVTPVPFRMVADLNLQRFPVRDVDSYLPDNLTVFIADGLLDTKVSLALKMQNGVLTGTYVGSLGVRSFYCLDGEENDLLKWESLQLDDVSGGVGPFSLAIKDVALNNAYARVTVEKDGKLNLQHLMSTETAQKTGSEAQAAPPPAPATPPPASTGAAVPTTPGGKQVKIGAVTIQNMTLAFSDNHLKQGFSTTFYNLGGSISGLSSEEQRFADVDLRGNLENHSPLRITGTINPLRDDLFVDLKVSFSDIDLSPVTPYSGTFLGYTVDKGKLFLDLKYRIEKKSLTAENKVFIDQFTFGKKVESDKATNLPVRLAIALLKDRKGEIHLDMPLSGRTDDPKFSVWGVLLDMLKNLLVKAATSPLTLLQSAFSGKEDFSTVRFPAGSSHITPPEEAKLLKLAEALRDRPGLDLDMAGYVDRDKDAEGYRQELLLKRMKAEKFLAMAKARQLQPDQTQEKMEIKPEEMSTYLKAVYKKEDFPKPRNFLGFAKDIPDEEMKKLILAHTTVRDEQLKNLAKERVMAVMNLLVNKGKIAAGRLFRKDSDIYRVGEKEKQPGARVEFEAVVK